MQHCLKILSVGLVAACAVLSASAAETQPIEGGGTALITSGTSLTSDEKTMLNNNQVTELWKTGDTTLASEGISSFAGIIRVKGGILSVAAQAGLGTTAGATYVESGATLQVTGAVRLNEPLFLEGTGSTGSNGAFRPATNAGIGNVSNGSLTLTGNTLINSASTYYFTPKTLDMGGHTLTFQGAKFYFQTTTVLNPGAFTGEMGNKNNTIWMMAGSKLDTGDASTFTMANNTSLSFYNNTSAANNNWTLRYSGSQGFINVDNNANTSASHAPSRWNGPVTIDSGKTLKIYYATANSWHAFPGPISGAGGLTIDSNSNGTGTRLILSGTNTYTGVTSPNKGAIWFMHRKAVPCDPFNTSKFGALGSGASMVLPLRDDADVDSETGWTAANLKEVYDAYDTSSSCPFTPDIVSGGTFTYPYAFDASHGSYAFTRHYQGGGTVRLTGDFAGRPTVSLSANPDDGTTVVIDGSGDALRQNQYGRITFENGRFRLENTGLWFTSAKDGLAKFNVEVRGASSKTRVTFGPGAAMGQTIQRTTEEFHLAVVDNKYGTLEFLDGCAFTNKLLAGYNAGSQAAVYQRGGDVYFTNGEGNDAYWGDKGYCFYEKTNGKLYVKGGTRLGKSTSGSGVFHGRGDWTVGTYPFAVGVCGTGVLYQTSGRLSANGTTTQKGSLSICNGYWGGRSGGHGNLTVRGADAEIYVANDTFFMADTSNSRSYINLMDGGTFRLAQIRKSGANSMGDSGGWPSVAISDALAYVNFNGGVLKSTGKVSNLFGSDDEAPDRVTVFSGGAVIDTAGHNANCNIAIQAPTGKGIASIAFPDGFVATGYMGPPVVTIAGDGIGATAVCEFDSTNQVVTGITVTSPGWNYTTATVTLSRGGKTTTTTCVATLADNATTGGLTKRGAGTLSLLAANTYGGSTRIEGGTLSAVVADAVPSGSEVVFAGGVLAVGTGVSIPSILTVDGSAYQVESGRTGKWTLMTVADGAAAVPHVNGLPKGYTTSFDGGALTLHNFRAMIIVVR